MMKSMNSAITLPDSLKYVAGVGFTTAVFNVGFFCQHFYPSPYKLSLQALMPSTNGDIFTPLSTPQRVPSVPMGRVLHQSQS